jgi:hypothetical protein
MGHLACICGHSISNVASPSNTTGYLITDLELEESGDKPVMDCGIEGFGRGVWECEMCGRIAVDFPNRNDRTVKWYRPEDDTPGDLLAYSAEFKARLVQSSVVVCGLDATAKV